MAVTLGPEVLLMYRRFSLYNSPFVAHERGRAIDLYPPSGAERARSPVAGEILDTRSVEAPPRPYAADRDHLILIDTGERVARVLHVKPSVEAGETVAVGEGLGELVRAGFFAPWVPNHLHLGFREPGVNPYRASGSLPIEVGVEPVGIPWDGTGTVTETGETWARLDAPAHPAPGERFAGLASGGGVLDGGFPHYEGGGLLGGAGEAEIADTRAGDVSGRDVDWIECTVLANGAAVTGIALFCARDRFGIKLVDEGIDLDVGQRVEVSLER